MLRGWGKWGEPSLMEFKGFLAMVIIWGTGFYWKKLPALKTCTQKISVHKEVLPKCVVGLILTVVKKVQADKPVKKPFPRACLYEEIVWIGQAWRVGDSKFVSQIWYYCMYALYTLCYSGETERSLAYLGSVKREVSVSKKGVLHA